MILRSMTRTSKPSTPVRNAAMNGNSEKPPYRVPSMDEIRSIPWNGYNVVSTFSGCGGSCLGYRMAGFRVLWANEFVPEAQKTYKANHPNSILDGRDIRKLTAKDILSAINLDVGEIDVFDGSPPCASFSIAGKREGGWGKIKKYSDTKQRTDDLFFEYTRILKGLQPKLFIAENVAGLVAGTAKGYFKMIIKELKDSGYIVKAKVLDAKWLGVPQSRVRLIFIGVRKDLRVKPTFPNPLSYRYSVKDAIPYIKKVRHGGHPDNYQPASRPSPTIVQSDALRGESSYLSGGGWCYAESDISKYAIGKEWNKISPGQKSKKYITQLGGKKNAASVVHCLEKRKFYIHELKRLCAFPDDFELTGTYSQQYERLGRAVPPVMMKHIANATLEVLDQCAE